ncbi:MAG: PKD domain-containing protein [Thermoplasmata archaeon]|nr:PKD domain-containing protein [Thermoplasmata archaeon]
MFNVSVFDGSWWLNASAPGYSDDTVLLVVTSSHTTQANFTLVPVPPGASVLGTIPVGSSPQGIVYDNVTGQVLVPNFLSANVSMVVGSHVVSSASVGSGPYGLAYDPRNGETYVANSGSGNVTLLSGTTHVGVIGGLGSSPFGVVFDPKHNLIYVSNYASNNISVISGSSVVKSLPVGSTPQRLAFDAANGYVYITNYASHNVSVLNGKAVLGAIPVGSNPQGIVYDPATKEIIVANGGSNNLSVISGLLVVATVPVGSDPYGVAFDSASKDLYVANYASDNLSIVSGLTVVGTVALTSSPYQPVYDPTDGFVYISAPLASYLWVIGSSPFSVTAAVTPIQSSGSQEVPFVLNFSGSVVGGHPPYSYHWEFGDGSGSTGQSTSHKYGSLGSFQANLSVMDGLGRTVTSSGVEINISAPVGIVNTVVTHGATFSDSGGSCSRSGNPLTTCFTIQQNFYISNSSYPGRIELGIQNAIVNGTGASGKGAYAVEQIYSGQIGLASGLLKNLYSPLSPTDGVFALSSTIVNGQLVLVDTWDGHSYSFPGYNLAAGTVSYVDLGRSLCSGLPSGSQEPVLQLVGPAAGTSTSSANFSGGSGTVLSRVEYGPNNYSVVNLSKGPIDHSVSGCLPGSQVSEYAFNLTWKASAGPGRVTFGYSPGGAGQGFGFTSRGPLVVVEAVTSNGSKSGGFVWNQSFADRIDVTANGTGLPAGSTARLYGLELSGPPVGIPRPGLSKATFFEVQVSGIAAGRARVCIALPNSSTASALDYWNGTGWIGFARVGWAGNEICGSTSVSSIAGPVPTPIAVGDSARRLRRPARRSTRGGKVPPSTSRRRPSPRYPARLHRVMRPAQP